MGFGFLIPLFIIGGFIYMTSSLFEMKHKNNKDSLGILKERYARGEINDAEYERIRNKVLE